MKADFRHRQPSWLLRLLSIVCRTLQHSTLSIEQLACGPDMEIERALAAMPFANPLGTL
jgi:hypothetical protein